jgi:glycine/D-amino acid oxidase-like deaminating enzyme
VTEPLDADVWAEIGWAGNECLMAGGHRYVYVQRTADDRIALGGDHRVYSYGSRTAPGHEIAETTVRELRRRLVGLFPQLAETAIEDAWSGIFGVPRDWCTRVEVDPASGLCSAGGYVGNGVTTANLAARTLRDGILGRDSALTRLPWSGRPARRWEPEPLRWLGVRGAHAAYALADRREAASGRASRVAAVADAVTGH